MSFARSVPVFVTLNWTVFPESPGWSVSLPDSETSNKAFFFTSRDKGISFVFIILFSTYFNESVNGYDWAGLLIYYSK